MAQVSKPAVSPVSKPAGRVFAKPLSSNPAKPLRSAGVCAPSRKLISILILSLLGNLALALTLVTVREHVLPEFASSEPAPAPVVARAKPVAAVTASSPAASLPFTWQNLESKDFAQYVAHLRAVGCPEALVRDVIVAEIDRSYARGCKLTPAYSPPWLNADSHRSEATLQAARQSTLESEKDNLIKAVLGYDWDDRNEAVWHQDFAASLLLGFLPDDKAFQVAALNAKYTHAAEVIREQTHGILIAEDLAQLELLYQSLLAEKNRLLDAGEFDELQLRLQASGFFPAFDIHVDGVSLSGAELRQIARYSTAVKDVVKSGFVTGRNVPAEERARRQAAFEAQVARLLGAERFADYQRAQDFNFRETYDFTQKNNLTKATAVDVYETRRRAEIQLREISADPSLSPDQQALLVGALKTSDAGAVASRLGSTYHDYCNGPGQWLDNLAIQTTPQPAGGTP